MGFSSFAATHPSYKCSQFLKITKQIPNPAMTIVLKTFGDSYSCVSRFLKQNKNKKHFLQIHLTNETCRRQQGRCSDYEIESKASPYIFNKLVKLQDSQIKKEFQDRVKLADRIVKKYANFNTEITYTTGLEDNYDKKTYSTIYKWIKEINKGVKIARNPNALRCDYFNGSTYCELHRQKSIFSNSSCIFNNDGNILNTKEQLKLFSKFRKCSVLFSWEPETQGRGKQGDKFAEPRNRFFPFPNRIVKQYNLFFKEYLK